MSEAVLLDIEGAVSPAAAMRNSLYPYARARLAEWVRKPEPEVERIADAVRLAMNNVHADLAMVTARLEQWSDLEIRAEPLRALEGLIWLGGFADGTLSAPVFDDVLAALRDWTGAGKSVHIFSAESELAQQLWFANSSSGDLSSMISNYFDTTSEGPDDDPLSYRLLTRVVGLNSEHITFVSGVVEKLDAAATAGLRTVGVSRLDDGAPDVGAHQRISLLSELTTRA